MKGKKETKVKKGMRFKVKKRGTRAWRKIPDPVPLSWNKELEQYTPEHGNVERGTEETESKGFQESGVSEEAIRQFVIQILKDNGVNLQFVPDAVEQYVYEKTISKVMHALENVIETVSIRILDHEIVMRLQPIAHPEGSGC